MLSLLLSSLFVSRPAFAVPLQLTQQGRLLDSNGVAVSGANNLTFRIFDAETGGNIVWVDTVTLNFTNGYYAAVLGADPQTNPLDSSVLQQYPLYMEVQFNSNTPMTPRQTIDSAPYAQIAGVAESVEGNVDATEIYVNGNLVIDGSGNWVGQSLGISWGDIDQSTIPGDLLDGDDDVLGSLSCLQGEIVSWDGNSGWVCTSNATLGFSDIQMMLANNPVDLHSATTIGGQAILTSVSDSDTLADLSCGYEEVAKYDNISAVWYCAPDLDTVLSSSEVIAHVESSSVNLAQGSQVDGANIVTSDNFTNNLPADLADGDDVGVGPTCADQEFMIYESASQSWVCLSGCADGEQLTYSNGVWNCQRADYYVDKDDDSVLAWDDCDDNDSALGAKDLDLDCDGVPTTSDCDDDDSSMPNDDADCDGVLTADDCDDNDSTVGACNNNGVSVLGYDWYVAAAGETCNSACNAQGLSCIDYVAQGFVEQGCSAGNSVCLTFYPGLSCGHDGDGPSVDYNSNGDPTYCRARLHAGYTFDACNYNANGMARSQICACQ